MTNTEEHPLPAPPFGPGPVDVPDFRFWEEHDALAAGAKPYPSRPDEMSFSEMVSIGAEARAINYEEDYLTSVENLEPPDDPS